MASHPAFEQSRRHLFHSKISTNDICKLVQTEHIFGLIQCDINVPEHLREYFAEMPPIFKNIEVGREDIGDFMKSYAIENNLLSQPRKSLIGSYHAKGKLLITPLLKWYLDHGLEVTDVQLVVEYKPKACFKSFGEEVSNARRCGDRDKNGAILAETFKLLGNR